MSLTPTLILNLALRSLWQLTGAHRTPHINILMTTPASGALLNEVSFWKRLVLIRLLRTDCWAHFKAQRHRDGSLSPFLGRHLRKSAICQYPHCDLLCSRRGDFTQHLGIGPFPVCEVILIATVMRYGLWESTLAGVCFLWSGSLTQTRPVNGLYCSFARFKLVWYSLPTQHNPQGVLITSHDLSVLWKLKHLRYILFSVAVSLLFARSSSWTLTS